jgi:beta-glucanase (GH16 family)
MRRSVFAIAMTTICAAAVTLLPRPAAAQPCTAVSKNTICESFDKPWAGNTSPDGGVRINGPWVGSGGNQLDPTLAQFMTVDGGQHALTLSVAAGMKRGSEIQTMAKPGYSYGYYEVRMRVTDVPGVCASFFWIEAPGYGPREWDFEFLTNEHWITSENQGVVHLTLHPSNAAVALPLPFNPSKEFHRYGFLWKPGVIVFTVDGKAVHTFNEADLDSTAGGFIMANTWTGNPDWGGGPPSKQAGTVYEWIKYTAGADSIIDP